MSSLGFIESYSPQIHTIIITTIYSIIAVTMKLKIQKDILLPCLVNASRFNQGRTISSVSLQGVLITVSGEDISIKSTNLNDFYEAKIKSSKGSKNEDGKVVVDSRTLIEYLNNLPNEELEIVKKEDSLRIIFGKNEGVFSLLSDEEFIEYPTTEGKTEELILPDFEKIQNVLFSTSKDDSRPMLTGVRLDEFLGQQCLVSTDGYRLSMFKFDSKKKLDPITIPSSFALEILRVMKTDKSTKVFVNTSGGVIFFENSQEKLISRLLSGEFPPFSRVIPSDKNLQVIVNRQEWLRAVKMSAVFAKDGSNVITLDFSKEGIKIQPKTQGEGGSVAHVELVSFEGEDRKVSFNSRFLVEFLNSSKDEEVVFEIVENTSPAVFYFPKNTSYIHIIMPLRTD